MQLQHFPSRSLGFLICHVGWKDRPSRPALEFITNSPCSRYFMCQAQS